MKRERARAARENATAMRVVGVKEGEGGKVMVIGTSVADKWMAKAMATTRAMVMKTKEAGEREGNGNGSKSNDDGKESGNDKR
jgi:hypothetical protein